jgi:hypothetical protein
MAPKLPRTVIVLGAVSFCNDLVSVGHAVALCGAVVAFNAAAGLAAALLLAVWAWPRQRGLKQQS